MRLVLAGQVAPKVAGLVLYALQTASLNLRQMKLEPCHLESVVIDPRAVAENGVGDDAWSEEEFEEEEEGEQEEGEEEDAADNENSEQEEEPVRVARAAFPERAEAPSPRTARGPACARKAKGWATQLRCE